MGQPETQPGTLEVFCLGRFQLRYGSQFISTSSSRANKTWLLLKFLLTRSQRMVATDVLVDTFWSESDVELGRQALYTCVHRLRSALKKHNLENLVQTESGFYGLNPDIRIHLDATVFEDRVKDALVQAPLERERLLKEALELYRGDFLPEHAYDDWAKPSQIHYRSLYRQAITAFSDLLVQEQRLLDARSVLEDAVELEPFEEEFHVRLLNVLWENGAFTEAARHFHKTNSLLYREYGVQPSPKLQAMFDKLRSHAAEQGDVSLELLQETITEMNESKGAFFCSPDEYEMICRLEQRKINRSHKVSMMASIMITARSSTANGVLLSVLRKVLRQGDVVSQYHDSLFLLLFPETSSDVAHKVMHRIHHEFLEHRQTGPAKLLVRLKSLRPVEETTAKAKSN